MKPKTKKCNTCGKKKIIGKFDRHIKFSDGHRSVCKKCRSSYWASGEGKIHRRKQNRNRKHGVIDAYGGKCECCGEKKIEFLSIDHTRNDGRKHRKEVGFGRRFYSWLIKENYPKDIGLRVLCMNCNFSMGHYGYCPHKRKEK